MKTRGTKSRKPPKTFAELADMHPLRPIRSERAMDRAEAIARRLAVLDRRSQDQEDYLQTLSLLIETYEDEHHAIEIAGLNPVDVLRSLLASHEMSASSLGRLLGNRSLGAAILRGDRELSKSHISTLCEHFAVGPALFLMLPPRLRKAS